MARYGKAFRERAVSRLLPPESATIDVVAKDTGVSSDTLERWRNEVLAEPARQPGARNSRRGQTQLS